MPHIPPTSLHEDHPDITTSQHLDHGPFTTPNVPPTQARQFTRVRTQPSYLHDYVCNSVQQSTSQHWCNLISASQIPNTNLCTISEANSYLEASHKPEWQEAMRKELDALKFNKTWELVPLPPIKKAIGSRWVYKVKLKADGTLERCKARLVAKWYNQKHGEDVDEVFSPVVKMSTVRCIISLAASKHWKLHQLDVNNAFLHGELKEEVYMQVPDGIANPMNYVCGLIKSIYGLRQASRVWFEKLATELFSRGFFQSKNDSSLFICKHHTSITFIAVYVDDMIITSNSEEHINLIKQHLDTIFGIKDLDLLNFFLGIEITYIPEGVVLSQKKFTQELLEHSSVDCSQKAVTPLPLHLKLNSEDGDLFHDPELYRSLLGKLNFLTHT